MKCDKVISVYNSNQDMAKKVYQAEGMLKNLEVKYGLRTEIPVDSDLIAVYNDGLELVRLKEEGL